MSDAEAKKDAPPQAPAAADAGQGSAKAEKKKKHGCLKGVLVFFVVVLLVVGGVAASALGLPRKWGLVKGATEKFYDVENADRTAAAELLAELEAKDIATKGMEVHVLPLKDGSGAGAYVVLDESQGFSFSASEGGDPFLGTLAAMARSEAAKSGGLTYVAFEYKDKAGRSLVTVGASVKDGADFADGKLSREEFMARVGGRADLQNVGAAVREILQ